jgi:hypothetical protein
MASIREEGSRNAVSMDCWPVPQPATSLGKPPGQKSGHRFVGQGRGQRHPAWIGILLILRLHELRDRVVDGRQSRDGGAQPHFREGIAYLPGKNGRDGVRPCVIQQDLSVRDAVERNIGRNGQNR